MGKIRSYQGRGESQGHVVDSISKFLIRKQPNEITA